MDTSATFPENFPPPATSPAPEVWTRECLESQNFPEPAIKIIQALQSENLDLRSSKLEVDALNQDLKARLEKSESRVAELEGQAAKNSSNSSKPPSTDGFHKPAPKSRRKKSGKRSGGQPGHPGKTLEPTDHPDVTVVHEPTECPCGYTGPFDTPVVETEKRQVVDIPPQKLTPTEYQCLTKNCPKCRTKVAAPFPAGVTAPAQ